MKTPGPRLLQDGDKRGPFLLLPCGGYGEKLITFQLNVAGIGKPTYRLQYRVWAQIQIAGEGVNRDAFRILVDHINDSLFDDLRGYGGAFQLLFSMALYFTPFAADIACAAG